MPGLFDRLKAELGDEEPSGVTPLEIADLPDKERRIMLWLLRDRTAASVGVTAEVVQTSMDEAPQDCSSVLQALAKDGWLISMGEPPNIRYKVNLRRKRGSSLGFGLWTILADRIAQEPKD